MKVVTLNRWVIQAGKLIALGAISFAIAYGTTHWLAPKQKPDEVRKETSPAGLVPEGMVWIPGGQFQMGTDNDNAWNNEQPAHPVRVDGFWMDATEVTNAQFRKFVEATNYVTTAERAPSVEEILSQLPRGTPPPAAEDLVPGSMVFAPPDHEVPLTNFAEWWKWTPDANWRHPEGPESDLTDRDQHPVVQVSWDDAVAYAKWAGKGLPTEAEWEFAARGGLIGAIYVWGNKPPDENRPQANLWTGQFPVTNTATDGFERTAPVRSFPRNGYGLFDMSGNVWEWCADWYDRDLYKGRSLKTPMNNPMGPMTSNDPRTPFAKLRSQRGGSYLCNDSYCSRYRPSARHGCPPDTGMSHVGFRCVIASRHSQK